MNEPTLHRGQILDSLPDDRARAAQCRQWSIEARNDYLQGKAETIADVLASRSIQYRWLSSAARKLVGAKRWSSSAIGRDLAGDEELFRQWAAMYSLAAQEVHSGLD